MRCIWQVLIYSQRLQSVSMIRSLCHLSSGDWMLQFLSALSLTLSRLIRLWVSFSRCIRLLGLMLFLRFGISVLLCSTLSRCFLCVTKCYAVSIALVNRVMQAFFMDLWFFVIDAQKIRCFFVIYVV